MENQEGFWFTDPNESAWFTQPKSCKEVLDESTPPVWRDPVTGLPMHNHSTMTKASGVNIFLEDGYQPCNCGNTAFDGPPPSGGSTC